MYFVLTPRVCNVRNGGECVDKGKNAGAVTVTVSFILKKIPARKSIAIRCHGKYYGHTRPLQCAAIIFLQCVSDKIIQFGRAYFLRNAHHFPGTKSRNCGFGTTLYVTEQVAYKLHLY